MRIRFEVWLICVIVGIISIVITLNLNFDRHYYNALMEREYGENEVGYQAHSQVPRVSSLEEMTAEWYFTVEINKKDLVATGVYKTLAAQTKTYFYDNKPSIWMAKAVDHVQMGQFYVLTLPSEEKILVFLDDGALSLKGDITLPIGKIDKKVWPQRFAEFDEKYDLSETSYYVEMAGYWRQTPEGQKLKSINNNKFFITFMTLIIIPVIYLGFDAIQSARKEKRKIQ